MPKVLAITAGDDRYFDLLRGAVYSLRDQAGGRHFAIAVLDLGLTDPERQELAGVVDAIRTPDWCLDFPRRDQAPRHLTGLLARPFLREMFPGYDVYLWLDADAWVQDGAAVDLFVRGAARRGLAVVPEVDRANLLQYGLAPRVRGLFRGWYEAAFGPNAADLAGYPMLNAGVFALRRDAPHWAAWAESLRAALGRVCDIRTDQLALNHAVYRRGLLARTELLPMWCNWSCHHALPAWDAASGRLVEPHLPHQPLGIVHLTVRKHDQVELGTTDGGRVTMSLRYTSSYVENERRRPAT